MSTVIGNIGLWFRQFHPAAAGAVRLICFPHAGGAATFFFPASRALSQAIDVVAVQYPGRQDRRAEACVDDLCTLADLIAAELLPLCDRPTALFGHSMGATVAYEVARRLERGGVIPLGLFASGRRAPSTHRQESVHLRDDRGIITALKELSGTDAAVLEDDELLQMILPAVRADYKAVETYRHQGNVELRCPIRVLVGEADQLTTLEEAGAWRTHTSASCQVEVFPGGHFYLTPQAGRVLSTIVDQIGVWRGNP
jgi:surfactin synthase thioesterase subunit